MDCAQRNFLCRIGIEIPQRWREISAMGAVCLSTAPPSIPCEERGQTGSAPTPLSWRGALMGELMCIAQVLLLFIAN